MTHTETWDIKLPEESSVDYPSFVSGTMRGSEICLTVNDHPSRLRYSSGDADVLMRRQHEPTTTGSVQHASAAQRRDGNVARAVGGGKSGISRGLIEYLLQLGYGRAIAYGGGKVDFQFVIRP